MAATRLEMRARVVLLLMVAQLGFSAPGEAIPPAAGASSVAAPKVRSMPSPTDKTVTLSFGNVSVKTLAQFFQALTGKEYVIDGHGFETLDLIVAQRLSVAEAEHRYDSALSAMGYKIARQENEVRIVVARIPATRVEGTVDTLPSAPLTEGQRETFDGLCSDRGSWISVRAPEAACGLSWIRQPSPGGYVYQPGLRRVRKIDAGAWATANQFGIPIPLSELFDVVCRTASVPPADARFVTVSRRDHTEIARDGLYISAVVEAVDTLHCGPRANDPGER